MGAKKIVTAVLLLFVASSVGWLVVREVRDPPKPDGDRNGATASPAVSSPVVSSPATSPRNTAAPQERVIVYYFHGMMRCATCRSIEAYTRETVESAFAEELRSGRLKMRVVNIDKPVNRHFVGEYELSTRSVVLVRMSGGKEIRWENLARVWELVREKPDFTAYIREKVRSFLK